MFRSSASSSSTSRWYWYGQSDASSCERLSRSSQGQTRRRSCGGTPCFARITTSLRMYGEASKRRGASCMASNQNCTFSSYSASASSIAMKVKKAVCD